jgi:hypothetical protein
MSYVLCLVSSGKTFLQILNIREFDPALIAAGLTKTQNTRHKTFRRTHTAKPFRLSSNTLSPFTDHEVS